MGLIIGGVPARDLILDGSSASLYVGGSPPVKVWPTGETGETVQITLGTGTQARNQLRAALSDRGLDYRTVEELPFEIELVGSGSAQEMFYGCAALTHAPAMNTSSVTDMLYMFYGCSSLAHVPDMDTIGVTDMYGMFWDCAALTHAPGMDTSQVTNMGNMFYNCAALTTVPDMYTAQVTYTGEMFYNCAELTDGSVRLLGRHPQVDTWNMILNSGLTREPFYDTAGNPI